MLLSKLRIPTQSEDTIHRRNLTDLLEKANDKKLVLLSALGGYGKTTLLSNWIFINKVHVKWCAIDSRDNKPFEFFKLFVLLNTVKTHLKNIYLKLEVDNSRKAVGKAKDCGII